MANLVQMPPMGKGINAETIQILNERILYPYQKITYVDKGLLIVKDNVKQGLLCVTNCTLTFYQPFDENAYDYSLTEILNVSYKKGFLSSEIEISLSNSIKLLIKNIPKGREESLVGLIRQTCEQWKKFEESQKARGLFRYGLNQDKWGSKEEVQDWLKQYLASRGFKKIESKWVTEQEYLDYCLRQKGLYKYIEAENEKWTSIDEILNGLSHFKFQDFIGILLESMGYQITKLPYVGDYGADLLARKGSETVAVQVKKYGFDNKVGAKEVQQTLGAIWKYSTPRALLITTSSFTKQAYEQARNAPIELWDREKLKEALRQYLPSNLVPEVPLRMSHAEIGRIEEIYKTIVSKASSFASPQTAMRIKVNFEREYDRFLVEILGPFEMYHLIEKATRELLPTLTPLFKNFFIAWLNTNLAKTELEHLKKAYPFFDEL